MIPPPRRPVAPTRTLALLALASALTGCALTGPHRGGQPLVPSRYHTTVGPYRIWTNGPVHAEDPAIGQLLALDRQLQRQLAVRYDPASGPIEIYILDDRAAFDHFLKFYYPELPSRRAFFLARGDRRVVYTYRGERLIEDLRHEATHALLHASAAELPLWLDEGLAEYFEVPEDHGGFNAEHVARLPADLASGWTPNLPRLEALQDVRVMTPLDYRESWAWVHYLLDGPPAGRTALLGYMADLRAGLPARPLSARLDPNDGPAGVRMVAHLEHIRNRPVAIAPPPPAAPSRPLTVIRGQDPTPEPRRRGPLGRMLEAIGLGRGDRAELRR